VFPLTEQENGIDPPVVVLRQFGVNGIPLAFQMIRAIVVVGISRIKLGVVPTRIQLEKD
jgi:hypothetical protein